MNIENRTCGDQRISGEMREGLIIKKDDTKITVRVNMYRCSSCSINCSSFLKSEEVEFDCDLTNGEIGDRVQLRIASFGLFFATILVLGIPLLLVVTSMLLSSSLTVPYFSLFLGLGISILITRTTILEKVLNFRMFVSSRTSELRVISQ